MISGLILAGGRGERLGGEKPLVPLGGRPLVRWVADALAPVVDELVVSIAAGAAAAAYGAALPGARLVPDRVPPPGPLGGLLSALPSLRGEVVCLAPCDAPFLSPGIYGVLRARAQGRQGAVPRGEAVQPLIGYFRTADLLAACRWAARGPDPSPTGALRHLDVALVEAEAFRAVDPDLRFALNVNSPRDLRRARALAARRPLGRGA